MPVAAESPYLAPPCRWTNASGKPIMGVTATDQDRRAHLLALVPMPEVHTAENIAGARRHQV